MSGKYSVFNFLSATRNCVLWVLYKIEMSWYSEMSWHYCIMNNDVPNWLDIRQTGGSLMLIIY